MSSFSDRLLASFSSYGQLCVGIDPHDWLLSEWGLPNTAAGAREFGMRVVDAAAGQVGLVKPQIAFFERFGADGYRALEEVMQTARSHGLLVIADVKRGDVGSSVEAYGQAWLTAGSPLEADAMTVSAYQGVGSLKQPFELAAQVGKGIFVLAATSNPDATELQSATTKRGLSVAAGIVEDIEKWNFDRTGISVGSIGVVLGATVDSTDYGIHLESMKATPILAPGFGHQGARFDQLQSLFRSASDRVIVSVSRAILAVGPSRIAKEIADQAAAVKSCRA